MSQNIEIEFKNLLTKQEFEKLVNHFKLKDTDFFTQENHYFDTPDFALKEQGSALRIRKKGEKYELTLKQPYQDALLETNESLEPLAAEKIFETGTIRNETIKGLIKKMNIDPDRIQYFGSLSTKRAEVEYENGLIVIDNSFYLNIEDFELEYEVSNRNDGQKKFSALLEQLEIPVRKTENKIKRFYNIKYMQHND
ncbi:CYTH domain-containing protein [Cytobacillus praedii]|uniref:CYTH domain-containing protein n=1 Tax=Cytobacillus praedii TaxID=1742358 RepID=A0A4V2NUG9_9BACI|nr:CYTH domain-containing protein [Cytobacillus praedii]TCJ04399.1 CYTH domain-containing protein [Cytobacillus praedii]